MCVCVCLCVYVLCVLCVRVGGSVCVCVHESVRAFMWATTASVFLYGYVHLRTCYAFLCVFVMTFMYRFCIFVRVRTATYMLARFCVCLL
jgi:hypothetical protein